MAGYYARFICVPRGAEVDGPTAAAAEGVTPARPRVIWRPDGVLILVIRQEPGLLSTRVWLDDLAFAISTMQAELAVERRYPPRVRYGVE